MNRTTCFHGATLVASLTLFGTGCGRSERGPTQVAVHSGAPPSAPPSGYAFEAPVRLTAKGEPIAVDAPGFACPTVADVDGDGADDLVVGQFASGKMKFFRNLASAGQVPQYDEAAWIQSQGKPAEVPGVW